MLSWKKTERRAVIVGSIKHSLQIFRSSIAYNNIIVTPEELIPYDLLPVLEAELDMADHQHPVYHHHQRDHSGDEWTRHYSLYYASSPKYHIISD